MVLLVCLRLAIGWHFLVEGLDKVNADSWSSEPYLRESSGPLANQFRHIAGDPIAEKLTPLPLRPDEDSTKTPYYKRFPPALDREWNAYFERFAAHYRLGEFAPDFPTEHPAVLSFAPMAPCPANICWAALYLSANQEFPPPHQRIIAERKLTQNKDNT